MPENVNVGVDLTSPKPDQPGRLATATAMLLLVGTLYLMATTAVYWLQQPSGDSVTYGPRDYAAAMGVPHGVPIEAIVANASQPGVYGDFAGSGVLFFSASGSLETRGTIQVLLPTSQGQVLLTLSEDQLVFHGAADGQARVVPLFRQALPAWEGADGPNFVNRGSFWLFGAGATSRPATITESDPWQRIGEESYAGPLRQLVERVEIYLPQQELEGIVG